MSADFEYVYVNQDGTVREVSPEERNYLCEKFDPFDGDRPYIKYNYNALDGWGSRSGFMPRRLVPKDVQVQPVNPSYNMREVLTKEEMFADAKAAGDTVVQESENTFSCTPNPAISKEERFEIFRRRQIERQAERERRARHPDHE